MTYLKSALQLALSGAPNATIESHYRKLIEYPHFPMSTNDLTKHHLEQYQGRAKAEGLSASTINQRVSYLKAAIERAGGNWPEGVKSLPLSKKPKWTLSVEQEGNLYQRITDLSRAPGFKGQQRDLFEFGQFVRLLVETGLRVEEALRLDPTHLIKIGAGATETEARFDALAHKRYSLNVPGTKTNASADIIPLNDKALEVIQDRIRTLESSFPIVGRSWASMEPRKLFSLSYERLQQYWMEWVKKPLGLQDEPTCTLKALRRTFATRLAASGCPAPILQKLLRHSSLATTSHYTHTLEMIEAGRAWVDDPKAAKEKDKDEFLKAYAEEIGKELSKGFDTMFMRTLLDGAISPMGRKRTQPEMQEVPPKGPSPRITFDTLFMPWARLEAMADDTIRGYKADLIIPDDPEGDRLVEAMANIVREMEANNLPPAKPLVNPDGRIPDSDGPGAPLYDAHDIALVMKETGFTPSEIAQALADLK